MDLSMFKEKITHCVDKDFTKCAAINRLCAGLKYFAALNVKNDKNDQEIFRSFVYDIYEQIVDDSNHFMTVHCNQFAEICKMKFGTKCNMETCRSTQRHFESGDKENQNEKLNDEQLSFYVNLLDSLHFVIFHCYDSGFRVKPNKDDRTVDAEFTRLNTVIRQSDAQTKTFERVSCENESKFVLTNESKNEKSTTFSDALFRNLSSELMHIGNLRTFIAEELYETDCIKMDVLNYGNIQIYKECILQFIKAIQVKTCTFSLGLCFYYWGYYKEIDTLPTKQQTINGNIENKHDHGGYTISKLFVAAKFSTFKEEITNYSHFTMCEYEETSIKATKFMESEQIKRTRAKTKGVHKFLHYGIKPRESLSFEHILSLNLYTDYSKLSTAFCSTFRKIHNFETLKSIKKRNACYAWMSKYLRELVECFGQCSFGDKDKQSNKRIRMEGPFFCGMNMRLHVGSFAMRLNGPTSTSKQIAVAIKFSGPKGIVFEFDNPSNDWQHLYLRGFDCSFISRYKEEDERLFFGGFHRIKVVNLRLIETMQNMKEYVEAIFYLDSILSGADLFAVKLNNKNGYRIINNLIDLSLKKECKMRVPQYIWNCFQSFRESKKQIILNMDQIFGEVNPRISNLIFHSLNKTESEKVCVREDDDLSNLVRSDIFLIFPYVQTLIIQSTDDSSGGIGQYSFVFSLMALLDIISATKLNEIIVKSTEYKSSNWIKKVWESDGKKIIKEFAEKNFKIEMQRKVGKRKKYSFDVRINLVKHDASL